MEHEQILRVMQQSINGKLLPEGRDSLLLKQKVQTSAGLSSMLNDIRNDAESLLQEPISELSYSIFRLFGETGSRKEYEQAYFRRRRRLTTFGIMCWLEPEQACYRDALSDILWSICGEYTWCLTAHLGEGAELDGTMAHSLYGAAGDGEMDLSGVTIDLFAAETAFTLSEILQLLGESLPALVRKRVSTEILNRVLRPFASRGSPYHWERSTHNWASVCAGSIGSAALYMLEDPEELTDVLVKVLPAIESYLSGFADDGACTEGYGYWEYGFGYFVYFADLLKARTSGDIDLFFPYKIQSIAMFQQKAFLDERYTVNFSDSPVEAGIFMGLSHYLHRLFEGVDAPPAHLQAAYSADHCSRWAPAFRNLFWFDDQILGQRWQPATSFMSDAQWFVSRHVTTNGRFTFAAKGGHNNEPHNHNDVGQFILHACGESLICDIGSGLYTRDYFGPRRYDILCNASFGHSVPIINGLYQSAGAEHSAHVLEATTDQIIEIFALEMADAYVDPTLQKLGRTFRWKKSDSPVLELEDTYTFEEPPLSIVERFICSVKPSIETGVVHIGSQKARLKIRFDNVQLEPQIVELVHINHFDKPVPFYAIDFHVRQLEPHIKVRLTFESE
jgi:hypothetical protein